MKRIVAFVAAIALLSIGYWMIAGGRIDWLFVRWDDVGKVPFKVSGRLEIATRWSPIKSDSLSLICGADGVHLMAKGRLPMDGYVRAHITPGPQMLPSTILFDLPPHIRSFRIAAARVELGAVDTVVMAPLTAADRVDLLDWFGRGAPGTISVDIGEEGIAYLRARSDVRTVGRFIATCP